MDTKLLNILREIWDKEDQKNILTSSPKAEELKKFNEITEKLSKILKKSKIVEKSILYNTDTSESSMFKPSVIARGDLIQYIGEYSGQNFLDFSKKIAKLYEKAGFKTEAGYGIDDIKGFEVKDSNGEVVGEVDFLVKDSIPNYGDMVIVKHRNDKNGSFK